MRPGIGILGLGGPSEPHGGPVLPVLAARNHKTPNFLRSTIMFFLYTNCSCRKLSIPFVEIAPASSKRERTEGIGKGGLVSGDVYKPRIGRATSVALVNW